MKRLQVIGLVVGLTCFSGVFIVLACALSQDRAVMILQQPAKPVSTDPTTIINEYWKSETSDGEKPVTVFKVSSRNGKPSEYLVRSQLFGSDWQKLAESPGAEVVIVRTGITKISPKSTLYVISNGQVIGHYLEYKKR